jgi:hypothetical protein
MIEIDKQREELDRERPALSAISISFGKYRAALTGVTLTQKALQWIEPAVKRGAPLDFVQAVSEKWDWNRHIREFSAELLSKWAVVQATLKKVEDSRELRQQPYLSSQESEQVRRWGSEEQKAWALPAQKGA